MIETIYLQSFERRVYMKHLIAVSQKQKKADFIIRNAKVADLISLKWVEADVVVTNGKIVAVDETKSYEAITEEDAKGRYVIPGLIDAHIHIESSMLTPEQFSEILLPHGITAVVTDPHEIANVAGAIGLQYMIDAAKFSKMDIFYMLPSSVPCTSFENAGAHLTAADLEPFTNEKQVLGIAEVMDFPAVLSGDENMLQKIQLGHDNAMIIDGHGAGLNAQQLTGYRAANIHTDHECVSAEEALERVKHGMYVLIREGSAAKNLKAILPAVNERNARRFAFCTDDKHLDEIIQEGTINHDISLAIQEGMSPLLAIQLATLNAAECYRLHDRGLIAPGYKADFILLDSLDEIKPNAVWKNGEKVVENGQLLAPSTARAEVPTRILNSVQLPKLTKSDLALKMVGSKANVIEVIPNQIVTKKLVTEVDVVNGEFVASIEKDYLKIAVIERHHQKGTKAVAIVHGLGLQKGAIATTIAHDSHNAIVAGTNDEDMLIAIEALQKMQGGLVVVADGKVIGEMALSVGGIMTTLSAQEAETQLLGVHNALKEIHPSCKFHLFLTLSFLSLPVIPSLKLTDTGLFDVENFRHISVEA